MVSAAGCYFRTNLGKPIKIKLLHSISLLLLYFSPPGQTQKTRSERMGRTFANQLNGYVLVLTYIPSHRAGKKDVSLPHDGFMIHRFCPAFVTTNSEGSMELELSKHRVPSEKPPIPADILEEMKIYWACLRKYVKNEKFWRDEAVYGQFYDGTTEYWRAGLNLGKEFVSEGGNHCLTKILEKYSYEAGKFYGCEEFVSRLRNEIGVDVMVTFRTSDEGFRYLNEIHVLYNTDLQMRSYRPKKLDFEDDEMFYLEDIQSRFGSTKVKLVANKKKKKGPKKGKGKGLFGIFRKFKLCLGK